MAVLFFFLFLVKTKIANKLFVILIEANVIQSVDSISVLWRPWVERPGLSLLNSALTLNTQVHKVRRTVLRDCISILLQVVPSGASISQNRLYHGSELRTFSGRKSL
jgi:hypothetical protein